MLDSVHHWREALQPKGLSPATGPGPAASAPPLGHHQRCFQLLSSEGLLLQGSRAAWRMFLHEQDSPTGSHINHRGNTETIRSVETHDGSQLPRPAALLC